MPDLDISRVAKLARIELTDEEIAEYTAQLSDILGYVEQLKGLDVSGIEATAHANPVFDVLREDEVRDDQRLSQDAALSNAPEKTADQFKVPTVIE